MGHPAPGFINTCTVDWFSSMGVWRQHVTVKEIYILRNQYYGIGEKTTEKTMIHWKGWDHKKKPLSNFDSLLVWP
jgi:hypothetical protein